LIKRNTTPKKMNKSKAWKEHGSLQNVMLALTDSGTPQVGKRATIALWTDRYVIDIVWVSDDKKKCLVRRTEATLKAGCTIGDQDWNIISREDWILETIVFWRGKWRFRTESDNGKGTIKHSYGNGLAIMFNVESYHYDWTF